MQRTKFVVFSIIVGIAFVLVVVGSLYLFGVFDGSTPKKSSLSRESSPKNTYSSSPPTLNKTKEHTHTGGCCPQSRYSTQGSSNVKSRGVLKETKNQTKDNLTVQDDGKTPTEESKSSTSQGNKNTNGESESAATGYEPYSTTKQNNGIENEENRKTCCENSGSCQKFNPSQLFCGNSRIIRKRKIIPLEKP